MIIHLLNSARLKRLIFPLPGEKSLTTKRKWKWYYCKYTSVDTNEFNTQYYEIDVSMNVRRDRSNQRGFVIGFVAYEDGEQLLSQKTCLSCFSGFQLNFNAFETLMCFEVS